MGGWDYYCFICATGFHVPFELSEETNQEDFEIEDQESPTGLQSKALFPKELVRDRLEWLSNFRTIGQNRNATGLTQCYLSGPAQEQDYGSVYVSRSEHPNAPEEASLSCYRDSDEETGDLPVHDNCFAILCKVFAQAQGTDHHWTSDSDSMSFPFDLDALFSCLASVRGEWTSYLQLDHNMNPQQYFGADWSRIYDYFDPLETQNVSQSAASNVHTHDTEAASKREAVSLFDILPHELLMDILDLTSPADLVQLIKASRTIRRATKEDKFWQRRLRLDAPWLWEINEESSKTTSRWRECYKAVMMQVHKPLEAAAKGANISGLTNRRRIWRVCEQILQMYLETNDLCYEPKSKSIFEDDVECRYLPVVANQQKPQYRSDTGFFFNNKSEMHAAKQLKLKWTDNGALCGISLTTGAREVIFGDLDSSRGTESVMDFEPDDWIEKLVLNISVVESWKTKTHYGEKSHRTLAVTGIAVWLLSHSKVVLGKDEGFKRLLEPDPENGIVGLKTQFAEGRITHLGLLEHREGPTTVRTENNTKRLDLLWDNQLPSADLRFKDFHSGYWMSEKWDLVPMQTLLFGSTELEQSTMTGFGASADFRCFEIYRSNGTSERVGQQESPMKVFNVDGPGGERVAGFEMTIGALPVGLTLVTTHGRQAVFGKRADNARHGHTSENGFGVAGIYCSFAYSSTRENLLSSLGLVQSPHIERPPMDEHQMVDEGGLVWEPRSPPSSWRAVGQLYGPKHRGEVAVCIDFSRPIVKIDGLFPAPEWLAEIEIGGFMIYYGDEDPLDPISRFGFPPQQWPDSAIATPESLRSMPRYSGMSRTGGRDVDTGKAHVLTDEEALEQPKTWYLGEHGEKIVAVTVWAGDYLHGLQFHSESGKESPCWGKCGAEPSATIHAGGQDQIVGVKVVLGSRRLSFIADSLTPQAVQAISDAEHS